MLFPHPEQTIVSSKKNSNMTKKTLVTAVLLIAGLYAGAQSPDKQISATFGYSSFYIPDENFSYVELYLSYDAWNMNFVSCEDGLYRATVETVVQVLSGDSTVYLNKYDLKSPGIENPEQTNFNFLDLHRFGLGSGIYNLRLTIRDKNGSQPETVVEEKLVVDYMQRRPDISSIQIMSAVSKTEEENAFSRMGYDMQPYVSDFIPERMDKLAFYYEIYCIDDEVGFKDLLTYAYIESKETGRRIGDIMHAEKKHPKNFIPMYTVLDISTLPSGNYNLVVEIHNYHNETILYKKVSFFRSAPHVKQTEETSPYDSTFVNQIQSESLLNYYLDALYPIATDQEKAMADNLRKGVGLKEKQAFFYKFWVSRNQMDPLGEWTKYRTMLDHVDKAFGYMNVPGYKTDRGRVYLQYGPPDFVRDEKNFVGALKIGARGHVYYLPYQLWRYNKLMTDDPNRCFLFWDEFRNGAYLLLNSNARGEVRDPHWERRLSQQQLEEDVIGEVGEQFERGY